MNKNLVKIENPNKNSLNRYFEKTSNYLLKCYMQGETSVSESRICFVMKALKKTATRPSIKTGLQWSLIRHNCGEIVERVEEFREKELGESNA